VRSGHLHTSAISADPDYPRRFFFRGREVIVALSGLAPRRLPVAISSPIEENEIRAIPPTIWSKLHSKLWLQFNEEDG
jgi:hypothetical protein